MPLVIEPIDPADGATMDAWFALTLACHRHDAPELAALSRPRHATRLSSPGFRSRAWAVRADARVVASAETALPLHDNLDFGFAHVLVSPAHRRRGLGSALLAHVVADARAQGRTRLALQAVELPGRPAPAAGFLHAAGARPGLDALQRRLAVPPPEPPADVVAQARRAARGYRLVRWTGSTPPPRRPDLAALIARMSTDAPHGEFAVEAQRWDADRVRERDAATVAAGERLVATAAETADGRLVAYTEIRVPAPGEDAVARQDDTLVAPEHRGHRLGLWIKLANLEQLAAVHPRVTGIDTWNADDNPWMVAVNDVLGFVPIARVTDWELDLAAAQAGTTAASSAAASGP
jgi:GNAT superfamily N-acetyltransferase